MNNTASEQILNRSESEIIEWIAERVANELSSSPGEVNPSEIDLNQELTTFGLDSIAVFTLTGDLAEWLNRDLRATLLWEFPTIQLLAQNLVQGNVQESDSTSRSLVNLQTGGDRLPLFCIDGAMRYRALTSHLSPDQPVYGLIPEDATDGQWYSFDKIGARARHYATVIRKVQPHGPYYLAGLSFAGVVAFLVAQELRKSGEEVGLLTFFDTFGPGYYLLPVSKRLSLHWRAWRQMGARERTKYLTERARNRLKIQPRNQEKNLEVAEPENYSPQLSQEEWEDEWQIDNLARRLLPAEKVYFSRMIELLRRRPKSAYYDGNAVIFVAQDEPMGFMEADTSRGWCEFMPELQIHCVPGTHTSMIQEPLVEKVAHLLNEKLRELHDSPHNA